MAGTIENEATEKDGARSRANTRARLLAAGRALFFARDYPSISVDLIAREAGFTRAAFYLHFTGKDDLLAAMMIAESHFGDPLFRWFERDPPGARSIGAFVEAIVAQARRSSAVRLFHLAALQSEAALDAFNANRRRLMAVMGEGFPAFRPAGDASKAESRRVARATLALILLEQLSVREAPGAPPDERAALIEEVVAVWVALADAYPV